MNKLLISILSIFLIGLVYANSSVPVNVTSYYNITLNNTVNNSTSANYTQNITFNGLGNNTLLNGNASNVIFFYNNGTIIPSWFEGNVSNETQTTNFNTSTTLMWWLNLTNGSSVSIGNLSILNIYMGFGNMTTNFFNNGTIGEAPQLSPTYAEYDNGRTIFPFYDDFIGTLLNTSNWNVSSTVDNGTLIVNNSLSLGITTNGSAVYLQTGILFNPALYTIDAMFNQTSSSYTANYQQLGVGYQNKTNGVQNSYLGKYLYTGGNIDYLIQIAPNNTVTGITIAAPSIFKGIISQQWYAVGNVSMLVNYKAIVNGTDSGLLQNQSDIYIELSQSSFGNTTINFTSYWVRLRDMPPSGAMPTVSFGNLINITPPNITISNTSIIYGQGAITITPSPASDLINISINGFQVAYGIGVQTLFLNNSTLLLNANISVPSANITVNDTTNGLNSSAIINISQSAPAPPTLFVNGTSLNNTTNTITNVTQYINVSINGTSVGNQLNWTIWYYYPNGTLNSTPFNISSVNSSNNFTVITLPTGIYNWTINTTGNNNYTAQNYETAQFNGNGIVSIPNSSTTNPSSITIGMWFEANTSPTASWRVISKNSGGSDLWGFFVNTGGTSVGTRITTTSGSGFINSATGIALNTFYYGIVTYNSTSNLLDVYLNGSLVASSNTTETGALLSNNNPICIGYSCGSGAGTENWEGTIANVQIYNTSLNATQISQLYNEGLFGQPLSNQGNIIYMPLDNNTTDYSGQGNNANSALNITYSQFNVTDNVSNAFNNLLYYNLNGSPVTYPNVSFFNVTPNYNGNGNITLNISIISATGHDVFSHNITNSINTTINNSNSTLAYGNLSAGIYTIYLNISDTLGNYLTNSTTFTINQATPSLLLTNSSNFTYNGSNGFFNATITTYNNQLNGTLWINGVNETTTKTNINYTTNLASVNTYSGIFNTTGNQNYTNATIGENFTINQGIPLQPTLYINSSTTNTYTYIDSIVPVNTTGINASNYNDQLIWYINYTYPNGTAITFNTTQYDINTSNFSTDIIGNYSWSCYTLGNINYTAQNCSDNNVILNISPTGSLTVLIYNLTSLTLTYPNTPSFNTTGYDTLIGVIGLTMNASLINYLGDEVYQNTSYSSGTNVTIPFNYGILSAGSYTLYVNMSDNLGDYGLNSSSFTINRATPTTSLGSCSNFTYNGSSCTEYGNVSSYNNQVTGYLNLSLNSGSYSNLCTSTTSCNDSEAAANIYSYLWNWTGGTNYTSGSLLANYSIFQATPTLAITNSSNFTYNNNLGYANGTITTINNQLNALLNYSYDNGTWTNYATTNTYSNYSNATAGFYNYTLNTSGNTNYTAGSINVSYNIAQASPTASLGSCINFTYNGSNCTETATISTINNQLVGVFNLSINSGIFNTLASITSGSTTDTESGAAFYNYTFNITGNVNYTSLNLNAGYNMTQASPLITLASNLTSFIYNGTPINFTGTITSYDNQLNGTLWFNGINVSVTNISTSYSNATAGIYTMIFNTTGNQNYSANSTNLTYEIYQATPNLPELLINGSNQTQYGGLEIPIWINSTNISSPNQTALYNQLSWTIWYYYPNDTLVSFNISNINSSNQFSAIVDGNFTWTINTTGNQNYTALNTYNITLNITGIFYLSIGENICPIQYYNNSSCSSYFFIYNNTNSTVFNLYLEINGTGYNLINSSITTMTDTESQVGIYKYIMNSTNSSLNQSGEFIILPASSGGGSDGTDLFIATVVAFLGIAASFWFIGFKQERYFRLFFISIGFFIFAGLFFIMPTFYTAYTVPVGVTNDYYAQAPVNSLTNISAGIGWAIIVVWFMYISLEVFFLFKELADTRRFLQTKKNGGYPEYDTYKDYRDGKKTQILTK